MPLSLRRGTVSAVLEALDGLIRIEVDGTPCVAYPRLTGDVAEGDEVLVNVQAGELGLGSGGFDVVHANLTRGLGLGPEPDAHVMVLPYTPLQFATRHVEEGGALAADLAGMPVVCCTLHSQLAPVCAGLGEGASRVRATRRRRASGLAVGHRARTESSGAPGDGDRGRLVLRRRRAGGRACLRLSPGRPRKASLRSCVRVGPGIVGTGSALGHGGVATAEAANVARALGGTPILAVRVSFGDPRERHQGVSHHTRAVLDLCLGAPAVGWPAGLDAPDGISPIEEVDVSDWQEACGGLPLEHMGRGPDDDPWFFAAAFAAGRLAARHLG